MRDFSCAGVICGLLLSSAASHAMLLDRGDGMIYDTDLDITWMMDANYAFTSGDDPDGMMDWDTAVAWASQLVYSGFDDWRLPAELPWANPNDTGCVGFNCIDTEMGYLFYAHFGGNPGTNLTGNQGPFIDIQHQYWSGIAIDATNSWNFHFLDGFQFPHPNNNQFPPWAVRDGDVNNGDLAPWGNPDGLINAADVLVAAELALGLRAPGGVQYAHGDMNRDGIINTADLLLILQTAL